MARSITAPTLSASAAGAAFATGMVAACARLTPDAEAMAMIASRARVAVRDARCKAWVPELEQPIYFWTPNWG
ncbi:MAG: hypothetical protein ACREOG_04900 [Gemmatimonadaceae bacterium]